MGPFLRRQLSLPGAELPTLVQGIKYVRPSHIIAGVRGLLSSFLTGLKLILAQHLLRTPTKNLLAVAFKLRK